MQIFKKGENMKERIPPYVQKLIDKGSIAIKLQFKKPRRETNAYQFPEDPLGEEERYTPVKGIVHKFKNRVLWKITYRCAGHCQICTRRRQIGSPEGDLTYEEIEAGADYIRTHPEVHDVIISGGDGMYPVHDTMHALDLLMKIESVKVIRIGTRMPFHSPDSFRTKPFKELLKKMRFIAKRRPLYVFVHMNHPDELTRKVLNVLKLIKRTGAEVGTQTVFLKGINDNVDALEHLFTTLYHNGIRPYYIYRCDYADGLGGRVCSFKEEKNIMTELRKRLSGPAYPTYIVDVAGGKGKIPPPLGFWKNSGTRTCFDFEGEKINLTLTRKKAKT